VRVVPRHRFDGVTVGKGNGGLVGRKSLTLGRDRLTCRSPSPNRTAMVRVGSHCARCELQVVVGYLVPRLSSPQSSPLLLYLTLVVPPLVLSLHPPSPLPFPLLSLLLILRCLAARLSFMALFELAVVAVVVVVV